MAADLILWESAKLMKWGQDPYHELAGVLSPLCAKSSRSHSRFAYGAERTCAVELFIAELSVTTPSPNPRFARRTRFASQASTHSSDVVGRTTCVSKT